VTIAVNTVLSMCGLLLICFAGRIADQRLASSFSSSDLGSADPRVRRRVRRFRFSIVTGCIFIGGVLFVGCGWGLLQ